MICPSNIFDATGNFFLGFGACFMLGIFLIFGGAALLLSSNAGGFAAAYSAGNLACILSTCFLAGPKAQFHKMFRRSRILSTFLILVFLIFTLAAAFLIKSNPLVLVCVVGQSLALTWYSLSYIPPVKDAFNKCLNLMLDSLGSF